ncbi:unnamed protein product [Phytophthora fragariaefolia]|uniref:Unnamed protein product n=1 Tax=Phytophthora fragariaefolia TaxID=1490495 RepID=A0A9W6YGQ5_9STRA|nr:unnamed protein product [Phytophthora fragariaefolia]
MNDTRAQSIVASFGLHARHIDDLFSAGPGPVRRDIGHNDACRMGSIVKLGKHVIHLCHCQILGNGLVQAFCELVQAFHPTCAANAIGLVDNVEVGRDWRNEVKLGCDWRNYSKLFGANSMAPNGLDLALQIPRAISILTHFQFCWLQHQLPKTYAAFLLASYPWPTRPSYYSSQRGRPAVSADRGGLLPNPDITDMLFNARVTALLPKPDTSGQLSKAKVVVVLPNPTRPACCPKLKWSSCCPTQRDRPTGEGQRGRHAAQARHHRLPAKSKATVVLPKPDITSLSSTAKVGVLLAKTYTNAAVLLTNAKLDNLPPKLDMVVLLVKGQGGQPAAQARHDCSAAQRPTWLSCYPSPTWPACCARPTWSLCCSRPIW